MYHEVTNPFAWPNMSYYDTIEEIPDQCVVCFPDKSRQTLTFDEMISLADSVEWYVIVNDCNYGVCDHWISKPFGKWVRENFPRISRFVDKAGEAIGYRRVNETVHLTKDAHFHKSEVWNS